MDSRRIIKLLVLCLTAGRLMAQSSPTNNARYFPLWQKGAPNMTDMVLIYDGGPKRPDWTPADFAPYVSAMDARNQKEKWLFDGFLFIEFVSGKKHAFENGLKLQPADKQDWEGLLATNFAPGHGLAALEQACADAEARLGRPTRPRQVVLTLPEPLVGATNWGELNGRKLNFSIPADRLAACEWHVDQALKRWQELAPRHLTLAGFYFVPETVRKENATFLPLIAQKIHERGKQFFWIPYFQSGGSAQWKEHGFDEAWYQPNYFFHPDVPPTRLQQACDFARQHGMGVEMELDGRLITQPQVYAPRLDAYLKYFEANGAKTNSSITYYEGGGALLNLYKSGKPDLRNDYERVVEWVVDRQRLADARQ